LSSGYTCANLSCRQSWEEAWSAKL
jgi:hypothetical protein